MVLYCNFWRSRNRFADTCPGFLRGSGWDWAEGKHPADHHWCQQEAVWQASELPYCKVWGFPPLECPRWALLLCVLQGTETYYGGNFQWLLKYFQGVMRLGKGSVPGATRSASGCPCCFDIMPGQPSFPIAREPSWLSNALVKLEGKSHYDTNCLDSPLTMHSHEASRGYNEACNFSC